MLPRIAITCTWSDNDVVQLTFEVCNGVSVFTNEAYASLDWGATRRLRYAPLDVRSTAAYSIWRPATEDLSTPADRSGLAHYYKPNQLLISTIQQGDFFTFKGSQTAPTATLFLRTEPSLLDRFIAALPALDASDGGHAVLECVPLAHDA